MKAHSLRLLALSSFGLVGACAAEGPKGPLTVEVAPLTLPGIADVCYGLTVFNGNPANAPDTVWSLENVCSTQYGNSTGGDITYIGTCDADSGENNYVQLILESIEDDNGDILLDQNTVLPGGDSDFINPCANDGDCVLNFPCVENEDVLVEFNISVMRDAEQGFFDIAVNFEDIFCSAKADSCYDADSPITLLYGDDDNDTLGRDHTLVVGFACTAGPDFVNSQGDIVKPVTQLIMTAPQVTCSSDANGEVSFEIPLTGDGGNGTTSDVDGFGYALHYGIYFDEEDLNCGEVAGGFELVHVPDGEGRYPYSENGVTGFYAVHDDLSGLWTFYNPNGTEFTPPMQWAGPADAPGQNPIQSGNGLPNPKFTAVMTRVQTGESTPLSCNKAFFNFAIDIENLAGQGLDNCTLDYGATAQDGRPNQGIFSVDNGEFIDSQAVYGAVRFAGVKLTDEFGDTVCDAHPLNGTNFDGEESNVTSVYVFGDAYDTGDEGNGGGNPPRYYATGGGAATTIVPRPEK